MNNNKVRIHLIIFSLAAVVSIVAYIIFVRSEYFTVFQVWVSEYKTTYYFILISVKIIGIVWPPIPGGVFTLGSIPVLGWQGAYVSDLIGSMIGSAISYQIAYKWGESALYKIFDDTMVGRLKKIKLIPQHEMKVIFLLRFFGGTVVEIICYGAGLLKVNFKKFMIASVASHVAIGIPTYYLFGGIVSGKSIIINIILIMVFFTMLYFFRHKYFEEIGDSSLLN